MALDRADTIRNAEKLLRQGKLPAAIAEYVRIVEESPGDWGLANTLGDLYVRAGQPDKAVEQFVQIADSLSEEGSLAKASAVYKKILKLKPDHEHTLLQVADILGGQGLYADARGHLNTLIELRRAKGDARGALQAKVRLGSLDPEDYDGRMAAVSARIEMGDVAGAHRDLKEMGSELADKGRHADAVNALREAEKLNPHDDEVREKLLDVYFAAGDFAHARECATSVEQFRLIASALEGQDRIDEALETLRQAAAADPTDSELRVELARTFVARGDIATAAEYLTLETAGDDPELLLTVADIKLRGETADEGFAIVRRLLEQDVSRRERIAALGWRLAEQNSEMGFRVVELAADAAVVQGDWPAAAAALQEFVTRVPSHIPALMRLVEICVDGGLEATMFAAQGHLADAYIAAGAASEALFIAEDLVAREPWEKANIERFRRALVLLGEPDPDARIAERLSGEVPFTSTDLLASGQEIFDQAAAAAAAEADAAAAAAEAAERELLEAAAAAEDGPVTPVRRSQPAPMRRQEESQQFELSSNAIDLDGILSELDAPPATAHAETEDVEVNLSIVLEGMNPAVSAPLAAPAPEAAPADLDGVFGNLREQASRSAGADDAEREYKRGLALKQAGDLDGCVQAFQVAARSPRLRFAATALVGRVFRDRGMAAEAIEWMEQASQAPAPTEDEGYGLLYELAELLEHTGETARALAVSLELQADAGSYRDLDERIERLSKVQAGG